MTTTETVLHAYKNGNCNVTLWSGGTKTRETLDADHPWAEHPESIDIKVTNFCDLACPYCHENSTLEGKHGDLNRLLTVLEPLPSGVELAIGGGNPLSHPDLIPFLRKVKTKGLVANLTVNERHLEPYKFLLSYLRRKDSPRVLSDLSTLPNSKTLVLGYKTFGRGVQFYGNKTKQLLSEWYRAIPTFLGKTHLSFDNLAVDQLNIKRLLTNEGWSKFFMGDDGSFTMYIDAVDGTYAKTSRSSERTPFDSTDLLTYFQSLSK